MHGATPLASATDLVVTVGKLTIALGKLDDKQSIDLRSIFRLLFQVGVRVVRVVQAAIWARRNVTLCAIDSVFAPRLQGDLACDNLGYLQ